MLYSIFDVYSLFLQLDDLIDGKYNDSITNFSVIDSQFDYTPLLF